MTNYEYIQTLSADELAMFLCFLADESCTDPKKECPFEKYCSMGTGAGVRPWLLEEHIIDERTGW